MTELLIKNIISEIIFDNKICESLENNELVNYLYEELLLDRLLYGEPVTVPELRKLLHQKIVNFEFIKLDGEIRPAKGTTMMKYIPQPDHPKGIRHSSPKVATFYDLQKQDWRSVSQRSKEIVLKKSEETGKPIVMVKDKTTPGDVTVKDIQPKETINGKPIEEPIEKPQEFKPEITKVKPVEKTDEEERFYVFNPVTGASIIMDVSAKDIVKKLKELGKDWRLTTQEEYERREEELKQASEEKPEIEEEPEEEIPQEKETKSPIENIKDKDSLENIEASEI